MFKEIYLNEPAVDEDIIIRDDFDIKARHLEREKIRRDYAERLKRIRDRKVCYDDFNLGGAL